MDKKFKLSDQPKRIKIIYASVIGVLCVTAVVIGIVSANPKNNDKNTDDPVINLPTENESNKDNSENTEKPSDDNKGEEDKKPDKLSFVSPVVGEIVKHHSIDMPVFSNTLNEWRVHTGIDISTEDGANVYAAADGVVTKVYSDPFLGKTVEITHNGNIVSVYANLESASITVKEGDEIESGTRIGQVGDSSLSELADEEHLHFGIKVNGVSVNPLDYISEESKKASLGITEV